LQNFGVLRGAPPSRFLVSVDSEGVEVEWKSTVVEVLILNGLEKGYYSEVVTLAGLKILWEFEGLRGGGT